MVVPITVEGEYEFLGIDTASQCPDGLEVPQNECKRAFHSLWGDENLFTDQNGEEYFYVDTELELYNWDFAPCGCFYWLRDQPDNIPDQAYAVFSSLTSDCGITIANRHSQVICKTGPSEFPSSVS